MSDSSEQEPQEEAPTGRSSAKRIHLAISGRFLQILGAIFYLIGAVGSIGLVAGGHKVSKIRPWSDAFLACGAVIVGIVAGLGLLYLGHLALLYGKKLVAKGRAQGADVVGLGSEQPPVLYLRSFRDEEVTSSTPIVFRYRESVELPGWTTEEEHLAEAIRDLGPFVAIGKPDETLPQLGAMRISAEDDSWQATVTRLMSQAQLVIFRVGSGPSLWWEIEEAIKIVRPERLVFLIPDNGTVFDQFRRRLQPLVSEIPELVCVYPVSTTVVAILYFKPDGTPCLQPLRDAGPRANPAQPLRPMLRIALRPVLDQLSLPWTPPPIPLSLYLREAFFLYFAGLCAFSLIASSPWQIVGEFKLDVISVIFLGFVFMLTALQVKALRWLWSNTKTLISAVNQFKDGAPVPDWVPPDPRSLRFLADTQEAWSSGKLTQLGEGFEREARAIHRRRFVGLYLPVEGSALAAMLDQFPPLNGEFLIKLGDDKKPVGRTGDKGWFVLTNHRLIQKDGVEGHYREVLLEDMEGFEIRHWRQSLVLRMKKGAEINFRKVGVCPSEKTLSAALLANASSAREADRDVAVTPTIPA